MFERLTFDPRFDWNAVAVGFECTAREFHAIRALQHGENARVDRRCGIVALKLSGLALPCQQPERLANPSVKAV